jgi:thioredoxin-like negative regulator of GroEL
LGPGNTNPQAGELVSIVNQAHLTKLVKEYPVVVVDFWSQTCPPCMRFKPVFEGAAHGNKNKKVVFAMVNCDQVRDCATANNVRALPTFKFFFEGECAETMEGANEPLFRKHLNDMHEKTMSKSS